VEKNLDMDGRIELLQSIIGSFKPSGIDVSGLERDWENSKRKREKESKGRKRRERNQGSQPVLPPKVKVPY